MFPKISGIMKNFTMVQPVDTVSSRGAQGIERTGQNPFAGAVSGGQDIYSKFDQRLEQGYAGAQYGRDGANLGKKLNIQG